MMPSKILTPLLPIAFLLLWGGLGIAHGEDHVNCNNMSYEHRNQVDYGPIKVNSVRGTVRDFNKVPIPNACIGIFSESSHKLIAAAGSSKNGYFEIKGIPDGDYRLVIKYAAFCPANAKLRLESHSQHYKPLVVHMEAGGIDSCSYVDKK